VMQVELAKQLKPPLTEQQRLQLVMDLSALGLTLREIRERGNSVKLKDTFGTIAFQYWVEDLVVLKTEAVNMAHEIIRRRKEELLKKATFSEEMLERMGLVEVDQALRRQYELQLERVRDKLKARVKRAKVFVRTAPEDIQLEVKKLAEAKGVLAPNDPHWRECLPYLVAALIDDIEQIQRRLR